MRRIFTAASVLALVVVMLAFSQTSSNRIASFAATSGKLVTVDLVTRTVAVDCDLGG